MKTLKVVPEVQQLMTKQVHTLDITDSIENAQKMINEYNIRHIPVTSDGKLVGIISNTDIMRMSFGNEYKDSFNHEEERDEKIMDMLTLEHIMHYHPRTVDYNDNIINIARELIKEEFHALPVVDRDQLVGIITTTDIIRYFLNEYINQEKYS